MGRKGNIHIQREKEGRKEKKREDLTLPNCGIEGSPLIKAETRNCAPCYRGQGCKVAFCFDEEVVLLAASVLVCLYSQRLYR
jgi:hypothetical protein